MQGIMDNSDLGYLGPSQFGKFDHSQFGQLPPFIRTSITGQFGLFYWSVRTSIRKFL